MSSQLSPLFVVQPNNGGGNGPIEVFDRSVEEYENEINRLLRGNSSGGYEFLLGDLPPLKCTILPFGNRATEVYLKTENGRFVYRPRRRLAPARGMNIDIMVHLREWCVKGRHVMCFADDKSPALSLPIDAWGYKNKSLVIKSAFRTAYHILADRLDPETERGARMIRHIEDERASVRKSPNFLTPIFGPEQFDDLLQRLRTTHFMAYDPELEHICIAANDRLC
jgi:hypothetical protein